MAIHKKETTEQGQIALYHKILYCEIDAKYQQFHVIVGSYAEQKYRDAEKQEKQEKEKQIADLNLFRKQIEDSVTRIEAQISVLEERLMKLGDQASDIEQEPNLLNDEALEEDRRERLDCIFAEMDDIRKKQGGLYQEIEALIVQNEAARESLQAWEGRTPEIKSLYTTTYTLALNQSEVINKILDLVYPEIMSLEPFDGSTKI